MLHAARGRFFVVLIFFLASRSQAGEGAAPESAKAGEATPAAAASSPLKKGTVPLGDAHTARESSAEERDSPLFQHAARQATSDKAIEAILEPIREKHKLPGIVAGIVTSRGLQAGGAVGVRKTGEPQPITVNDQIHIGSDTKAMTATLLAMLVERLQLSWDSKIGDVFPDLKGQLHADFHAVTLDQLLTHRAGLPANTSYGQPANRPIVAQREAILKEVLGRPPVHPPGSKYLYSNLGYMIAAHFAEQITGRSWEELIRAELFEPLGMGSAGFGPPGTKGELDQPWGHHSLFGKLVPLQMDNPAVVGPAGRVHCSLPDWASFIALHLQGVRGDARLLKPEAFKLMHTPAAGQDYALGWVVAERPWAGGRVLVHAGSNTMWYAIAWLAPERDIAFLAATNQGGPAASEGLDQAVAALIGDYEKSSAATATEKLKVQFLMTPNSTRFGVLGAKPAAPAPTLFVFAHEIAGTLESDDYNKVGRLLAAKGFLCVALDLPCHGQNVRPSEPQGLDGWAARLRQNEDPIGPFVKQASEVLEYLIAEGYTDANRVAACGTSRGGFAALHFAAAEPRVRCVAAFAPVTELPVLREFKGLEDNAIVKELALVRHAERLAGRPVWMCIGNDDERVGTDQAIAFTRQIVAASKSQQKQPLVELHVMTSIGHSTHPTAHAEAAAWIAEK